MMKTSFHRWTGTAGIAMCMLLCAAALPAQVPPIETVPYHFGGSRGLFPYAGLAADSSGNLYGTTTQGGTADLGVVFKLDQSGHETVLHSFQGGTDGATPYGAVILDPEGNIYGTTYQGGANDAGVVYELNPSGEEIGIYSLGSVYLGGANPKCALARDSAGNLYGTATAGGEYNAGVVFKLDSNGVAGNLYTFSGTTDGAEPIAGVVLDAAGNLYGTTDQGGAYGFGVVFKMDPYGDETVLYNFTGGADGGSPGTGVILGAAGNLYGTARVGGSQGSGVVFRISPAGQETVLYNFPYSDYGSQPSGLTLDEAGDLYGTNATNSFNSGYLFMLDADGTGKLLYKFGATAGYQPYSGVIRDAAGNLYGTTLYGGPGAVYLGNGTVFKFEMQNGETVLCNFIKSSDGLTPYAGVTRDSAGNLYGATWGGGLGFGVVYRIGPNGQYSELYKFKGGSDGANPYTGGLFRDAAGNIYGTTYEGGTANLGTVFKLDTSGRETVLHSFTGPPDGAYPGSTLVGDSAGNVYGTTLSTFAGGGVLFKVDPSGNETVLYSFAVAAGGSGPNGGVILDSANNLYGVAGGGGQYDDGVIYKLGTGGQGYTVLYNFTSQTDGGDPYTSLVLDSAGNLYGVSYYGVVFELSATGQESVLYSFPYYGSGLYPSGLALDSAGNLYGTLQTYDNAGAVYELTPTGQMNFLHVFSGLADGAMPYSGVVLDPAGNLYGTASIAGAGGQGVVYKLNLAN